MGTEIIIRKATLAEQFNVFKEPRLLAVLPGKPKLDSLEKYLRVMGFDQYLIILGKYRMLFECYPYGRVQDAMEVHIACPKDSIRASRALGLILTKYVFDTYPETKGLVTSCPEGKIANLCRKLGGVKVGTKGEYVTMLATREQLGIK